VGEDPELDLRVVGRHEAVARRRDERRPDAATLLGADRDVLQVRIGAGERPVAATVWLKDVWRRPVEASTSSGSAST
jgi:hypothetical protein